MRHECRVDAVERTRTGQQLLSVAALLRGRAEEDYTAGHGPGVRASRGTEGEERPRGGRGDEVVAARVSDAGQRVVLGEEGDRRSGR